MSGNIVELRAARLLQPEIEAAGVRRLDEMSRVNESSFHSSDRSIFLYEDLNLVIMHPSSCATI